jgi:4-amino-4-deoxy-L-arabinose transferase-like glycosyltransferase
LGAEIFAITSAITSKRVFLALLCSTIFFFFAGWTFLPYLGIQTDEALFIAGVYQTQAVYYKMHAFGHFIPLMISSYNGTLKSLIYAGLFRIFTPDAASTRIPVILAGVATIWLLFLLLRRISGPWAAAAGALLLATDTSFLLTNTFDWGPVALQHLLLVGGLLLLYRYYESPKLLYLFGGFFLFGLAMWDKAIFIWSLTGLGVAALLAFPRALWRLLRPKPLVVGVLAFLLGALPLVMFNWDKKGETFQANAAWSTKDLSGKLLMLRGTLEGAYLFGYLVRDDAAGETPAVPQDWPRKASERVSSWFRHPRQNLMLAAVAGALLLVPLLWRARTRAPRTMLFAAVFLIVAWLAMAVNPSTGGSVHHTVLLWPFPHMLVGVAFGEAAQKFRLPGKAMFVVMLLLVIPSSLLVTNEYYRMLRRNGGTAIWSDAVYPLSSFLHDLPATQIMPIDWGAFDSLRLLNGGKLPLRVGADPLSKPTLDAQDQATVRDWLKTPGTIFLEYTQPNEVLPGVNKHLDDVAAAAGFRKESLRVVPDSHGRPIFDVVRYIQR